MLPLDPPLTPGASRSERHPLRTLADEERRAMATDRRDPEIRLRFARHLVETNPDSLLGRLILAELAPTGVETEALLRDAVRVGLRLWDPELSGNAEVDWYGDPATRLFMAAVSAYATTLARRGLADEAGACADFLTGLDPSDRIGIRRTIGRMTDPGKGGPRPV